MNYNHLLYFSVLAQTEIILPLLPDWVSLSPPSAVRFITWKILWDE